MSELRGKLQEALSLDGSEVIPMIPASDSLKGTAFLVRSIPSLTLPRLESTVLVMQLLFDDHDEHQERSFHPRDRYYRYYSKDVQKLISHWSEMGRQCSYGKANRKDTEGEGQKLTDADGFYRGCLAYQFCPQRMISLRRCWLNFMEEHRNDSTAFTAANIKEACKHKTDAVEACAGAKVEQLLLSLLSEQQ
jgi:hypothetical protein